MSVPTLPPPPRPLPPPQTLSVAPIQFPPPPFFSSFPQHLPLPPYPNAQALPPFATPNLLPTPHYFFPTHPIPIQQSCYWPSQFGQYIPQYTPAQSSLPLKNLDPKSTLQPSPKLNSHISQAKPPPLPGENGGILLLFVSTQRLSSWLLMGVVWILTPLKNRARIMVLFGLLDRVWIGSLHAW